VRQCEQVFTEGVLWGSRFSICGRILPAFSFWAILPIAPKPSPLAPSVLFCIGEKASLHAMRNKRRGYGVEYHLSSLQANHKTSKLSRDVARGSRRSQRIMKFQLLKAVVPPGHQAQLRPQNQSRLAVISQGTRSQCSSQRVVNNYEQQRLHHSSHNML